METLGGREWGVPWPCLHEFLATVTHPRILSPPSSVEDACKATDGWLLAAGRAGHVSRARDEPDPIIGAHSEFQSGILRNPDPPSDDGAVLDLHEELRGVTQALNEAGVAYALVCGLAVSAYTEPRFTEDIDLLISGSDFDRVVIDVLGAIPEVASRLASQPG